MLKIRRPLGRLIFNMGIAIPGKTVFLIETAPWMLFLYLYSVVKRTYITAAYPVSPISVISSPTRRLYQVGGRKSQVRDIKQKIASMSLTIKPTHAMFTWPLQVMLGLWNQITAIMYLILTMLCNKETNLPTKRVMPSSALDYHEAIFIQNLLSFKQWRQGVVMYFNSRFTTAHITTDTSYDILSFQTIFKILITFRSHL